MHSAEAKPRSEGGLGDALPRFSVLMANYNNADYIAAAIGSVQAQSFADWELVIIDDASTDSSRELIGRYAAADQRIRSLHNPTNLGYTATLRRLAAEARGEILAILDADDALCPEALEAIHQGYLENPECGLVYSQCIACNDALEAIDERPLGRRIPPGSSHLHIWAITHLRTFRKSAYERTSGWDESLLYAEDADLLYKLEEVTRVAFVERPLYKYRILEGSQSHDPRKKAIGRSSQAVAQYRAFQRRLLGSAAPNLTAGELARRLWLAAKRDLHHNRFVGAALHVLRALRVLTVNGMRRPGCWLA